MKIFTRFLLAFIGMPVVLIAQTPIPAVTFTATPATGCACLSVVFTNSSNIFPLAWTWIFPGGNPSRVYVVGGSGNPPSPIEYCTPGSYPVTCIVSSGGPNDTVTVNNCVIVDSIPIITFSGPPRICDGSSGGICATGGGHYIWSTGATTSCINITAVTGIPGITYTVQVRNGGCIKDTSFSVIFDSMPHNTFIGDTSICVGDSTTIFASSQASIREAGFQYSYLWSTGSTVDSIVVKGITPGYYTYTLTVTKGACAIDSLQARVHVHTCTGIVSFANPLGIEIFPNPASNILSIQFDTPTDIRALLTITDITGRTIRTEIIKPNQSLINIDVSSLTPSIYFLKLQTDEGIIVKKFAKE